MRRGAMIFPLSLIVAALFSMPAVGITPASINFQGVLLGSDGNPVPDDTYSIIFSIWDDSTGGTQYWTETQTLQTYAGGVNVAMGDVNAIDYDGFPENAYLQIQIMGDPPMAPRIPLYSVPYSFIAKRIAGDVESSPGFLRIRDSESDPVNVELQASGNQGNVAINDGSFERFALDVSPLSSGMSLAIPNATGGNLGKLLVGVDNVETRLGIEHEDIGVISSASSSADADGGRHEVGHNLSQYDFSTAGIEADSSGAGFHAVDSFFDIEYRVDYSASDSAGESRIRADDSSNSFEKAEKATPNLLQTTCSGSHENGHSFIIQSIDNQGSSGEYKWMPDIGDEVIVGFNADSGGAQLHLSNIGSSGQDGVSINVDDSASTCGIEHEDIGGSVAAVNSSADASGGALVVSNIGSSGQDGVSIGADDGAATCGIEHEDIGGSVAAVNSSADASGGTLVVSNIGSSSEDGVSASADSNGSRLALYTQPTGDVQTEILSLSLVSTEPLMAVRNPYGSSTDPLAMDYTYDALGNITRTSRSFDPFAPGDSSMTSASGFHVFDSSYELHFDTNGLTFSDAAGPTCSMHRTGTLTLKRGIVAAQDPTSSVGIGGPSTGYKLYIDGDVCATGSYLSCSDLRFKKNIKTVGGAVDKVNRLRGVNFDWRKNEFPERNFPGDRQLGMIAQEVLKVAPEAVSQDDEGYYSVDYARLVPILVEAVKEQQKTIESMQRKLEENDNLRAQLEELKSVVQQFAVDEGLSKKTITETTSY